MLLKKEDQELSKEEKEYNKIALLHDSVNRFLLPF
jgi:hypothetical protein